MIQNASGEAVSEHRTAVQTSTIDDLYAKFPKEMCEMGVMKVDVEGMDSTTLSFA